MGRIHLFGGILSLVLAISGCASKPTKEQTGMLVGALVGATVGSQVGSGSGRKLAILAGTFAGAAIGGAVGKSMDENDRLRVGQSLETVRTGVPSAWRNPDTGNEYTVTPTRTYDASSGPCREYTVDAVIGGKPEKVYGTACRQPDGSWKTKS